VGQFDNNNRIGEWKEYDIHGDLKRIQVFENGRKVSDKKVGIWRQYLEGGEVITGFDYDNNMEIDTEIRVNAYYPGIEIENGIEGLVEISVDLDNDCEVMELKVIKSLSERCDEQALKAVRRMCELQKKYDKENCHKIEKIIPIKFSLD
jgi:TonB family protein